MSMGNCFITSCFDRMGWWEGLLDESSSRFEFLISLPMLLFFTSKVSFCFEERSLKSGEERWKLSWSCTAYFKRWALLKVMEELARIIYAVEGMKELSAKSGSISWVEGLG